MCAPGLAVRILVSLSLLLVRSMPGRDGVRGVRELVVP
jgi:hypothetical protein